MKQAAIELSIQPNPVQNSLTITYPCNADGLLKMCIKDIAGKIKYAENIICDAGGSVRHAVDMSAYPSGVYLVDLTLNDPACSEEGS